MSHISRMQEDTQMYSRSSSDEKDLDQFGKLLLQMCNSIGLVKLQMVFPYDPTLMVLHVENAMEIV